MLPNTLSKAQVVSVDPDTYSLYCYLISQIGEGPVSPIKVLFHGRCDGTNINQKQLPKRGTLGVVGSLDGDPRSLVWLGSLPVNQQDAITTISGNQNIEYISHFSGLFSLIDDTGNTTIQWPDSSSMVIGVSGQPTVHRVINGQRQIVEFSYSQRVPNPPSAFPVIFTHATGTSVEIDSFGNVNVSGVGTVNVSGSTLVNIFSPNSIGMKAPTVSVSGNLIVDGTISAFSSSGSTSFTVSGTIAATEDIVASTFGNNISVTNHIHGGVTTGGGDTESPVSGT